MPAPSVFCARSLQLPAGSSSFNGTRLEHFVEHPWVAAHNRQVRFVAGVSDVTVPVTRGMLARAKRNLDSMVVVGTVSLRPAAWGAGNYVSLEVTGVCVCACVVHQFCRGRVYIYPSAVSELAPPPRRPRGEQLQLDDLAGYFSDLTCVFGSVFDEA